MSQYITNVHLAAGMTSEACEHDLLLPSEADRRLPHISGLFHNSQTVLLTGRAMLHLLKASNNPLYTYDVWQQIAITMDLPTAEDYEG